MTDQGRENMPERDRLTGHDYDGIQEYDNPLPGWWVWLFTLSIIVSIPYVMWYHLGAGPSIHEKLDAEIAAYGERLLAMFGDLEPDEATILRMADDEAAMAGMSGLFRGKCAQCHVADGSGSVGPNLTDDHWISVRQVTDIADIIINGRAAQGMPAWEGQLTQTQIVLLSAYVAQMRDNPILPPTGKEPQGEQVDPWPAAPPETADGTGDEAPGDEEPTP